MHCEVTNVFTYNVDIIIITMMVITIVINKKSIRHAETIAEINKIKHAKISAAGETDN